jgi:hypothetical protein
MFIKTLRKRIALVAVSALGVGLLSVAPASAVAGSVETELDNTIYGVSTTTNAAGTNRGICYITGNTVVLYLVVGLTVQPQQHRVYLILENLFCLFPEQHPTRC